MLQNAKNATNATNAISTNVPKAIPTNVMSTMPTNPDDKNVRYKMYCHILNSFVSKFVITIQNTGQNKNILMH